VHAVAFGVDAPVVAEDLVMDRERDADGAAGVAAAGWIQMRRNGLRAAAGRCRRS
jgi:hypothetical protein